VQPDGLIIGVMIGVSGARARDLLAAGQAVPRPLLVRGVIDTGTDATALAPRIAQALGVPLAGNAITHTAAGPVHVPYYEVSLSLLPSPVASPFFTDPLLIVTELHQALPAHIEVLVGLNVLLQLTLLLDGPGRTFTLSY
jgi:hypothetical protein